MMKKNKEICPNCKEIVTDKVYISHKHDTRHCPKCYKLESEDVSLLWNYQQYKALA